MFLVSKCKVLPLIFISILLGACGGGGGGGSGTAVPVVDLSQIPSPLPTAGSSLVLGSSSANPTASYGAATVALDAYGGGAGGGSTAATPSVTRWNNTHLTDTGATTAWASGWTGLGTNIAIIDDFSNTETYYHYFNITRQWEHRNWSNTLQGTSTHTVNYRVPLQFTHGILVSNIAGGDANRSAVSWNENWTAVGSNQTSCSGDCSNYGFYYSSVFSDTSVPITAVPMAGVAKEANVVNNHVDLTGKTDINSTLNAVQAHIDNSRNFDVINLSMGASINTSSVSFSDIASDALSSNTIQYQNDAVIVTALGNTGAACANSDLAGCNALAIAISVIPELKDNAIFAGALTGSGAAENIAAYSTRPGILKERSLLANGENGYLYQNYNTLVKGTSLAAPRITGAAAILRQKYPNLSGSQAASILLLTADKDINNDGINDFSGASETYGQGKLNLMSALSPVGTLAIQ